MYLFAQRTAIATALTLLALSGANAQMSQQPAPDAQPQKPITPPQAPMSPAPAQQPMQQILAKRAEIQELGQELQQIQQATIEANPELATQRDELVTLMDTKMIDAGHDPSANRDQIEQLQDELQEGELSESERKTLRSELQQEIATLQQAQGQVMQDEEVRSKRQSLNEGLVSAMQEQNPQTTELIRELQTARQEYQQLASQLQRQQGSGTPPGR